MDARARGGGRLDSERISRTIVAFGRYPEKRPSGLHVDTNGAFHLTNLMEVWGAQKGLHEWDVLEAVRRHMFQGDANLRFAIITDFDGNLMIRVHRRRFRSRSRTPLLSLEDERPRRRRRYQPPNAGEAESIRQALPAPPPPPPPPPASGAWPVKNEWPVKNDWPAKNDWPVKNEAVEAAPATSSVRGPPVFPDRGPPTLPGRGGFSFSMPRTTSAYDTADLDFSAYPRASASSPGFSEAALLAGNLSRDERRARRCGIYGAVAPPPDRSSLAAPSDSRGQQQQGYIDGQPPAPPPAPLLPPKVEAQVRQEALSSSSAYGFQETIVKDEEIGG